MCLRDPKAISIYAKILNSKLEDSLEGSSNWTKAFAHIVRFREAATSEIPSKLCYKLAGHFFNILTQEYRHRNFHYKFRWSALAMVFLLRRRIYDDGFLAPNSDIAKSSKELFTNISQELFPIIGGSVDMSQEMKKYINYIDRGGHGLLSWAE